jgi:hypothetical protein
MDASRRTLLAAAGAVAVGTAGCIGDPTGDGSPTGTDRDLPGECPTTRDLGVEWPAELDAETAASFVESYENAYYREAVVEYEPDSRVDEYDLAATTGDVTAVGEGYEVTVSGNGGVYHPTLQLQAAAAEPPKGADVVPFSEVEDDLLREVLTRAAESGEHDAHVDDPGERVDHYIEHVAALSDDVEPLTEPGDSDTAYFDVEGTGVELHVQATQFHGDYWWGARYYVDAHVVWRFGDPRGDPRDDGQLLECREET